MRNWAKHQHYGDARRPPWIKFKVELLQDDALLSLPIPTRLLWDMLLLLAAEYANTIPNDPELIAKLVRMPPRTVREGIAQLCKGRWLQERKTRRRASKPSSRLARPDVEGDVDVETPKAPLTGVPVDNPGLRLIGEG